MADSKHSDSETRFANTNVLADPACAARLRQEFSGWLNRYFTLDPIRASDVVLAVNEALANAAEFAYSAFDKPGAMHLLADYEPGTAVLKVTVADEGSWRITDGEKKTNTRGRGIPLMRALADRATIDSSPGGTKVCLEWNHVTAAQQAVT
ncbi:anti-sigma regulatory factor [Mycolicibacterium agri]|uniref:Anti-sigma regulatory factor n=1 Tax=Mycolicibacterium agri TaxID=36811 RepID=A0A2A7MRD2_MYCAG|nr:ATP-binding protein [Mycolicibacterium agri]PEG34129.1 anti-sigma regulatory factor [Mycolicibacterium agri]GFG53627.1 anti-sigma regulatory factor [Mycolicibacterium agri]